MELRLQFGNCGEKALVVVAHGAVEVAPARVVDLADMRVHQYR
jgi:hypothetical protein